MNEDDIRSRATHPAHPFDTSGAQAQLSATLLVLDELRAIRKLLEPEVRIEVAAREPEVPVHPLRAEWDSMLPHQRSHFGSFGAYAQMHEDLEAPDDEPMAVKWIRCEHLSTHQIANAMGEHQGSYAIQLCDLTDAQKALP